ncbi:MAG: TonB-dependent receptor [Bacteroidales bacterium]|nr:TonB-dependent receptor plug domain-containing protein [Bacteroidales bacterium]
MLKTGIIGFFVFFTATFSFAQKPINDSIFLLQEVEIKTERYSNNIIGVKTIEIDSNYMKMFETKSLNDALAQISTLYIKSNGVSGLSTIAIRGTGTSHTAILWNGFNIHNPMNGGMDLSLVPVGFNNKISIQYNGPSALYGSGSIGGIIHLTDIPRFGKGLAVYAGADYGSFINYSANAGLEYSNQNNSSEFRAFFHEGKNNFSYSNLAKYGNPKEKQIHSDMKQYGASLNESYKFNDKNILNFRLWYQKSDRNIPPTMTQEFSSAEQGDEFLRSAAEWNNIGLRYRLFIRSALFYETYRYDEPDKNIFSKSKSLLSVDEAEIYVKIFPFHTINTGINYTYSKGICDYYSDAKTQQSLAVYVSYTAVSKKNLWKFNGSLRGEYNDMGLLPPMFSAGMEIKIYKELILYANFSRNYRVPTMNDMFWYPGGNPELKPENAYVEELGIKQNITCKKIKIHYSVSGYNNNVTNWIIWLPESYYWSPQNIQAVWGRGAESNIAADIPIRKSVLKIQLEAAYTKSTVEKSSNITSLGKQLIYTPEANAGLIILWSYNTFACSYNMNFVSARYTSPDNSEQLQSYLLGNIHLAKEFKIKDFGLGIFFHLNNIWNQEYQTIAWQAMPGINFNTGIKLNFNKKTNKT